MDEDPARRLTNTYNWLHDALVDRSTKWGLRFDRNNAECATDLVEIVERSQSLVTSS